MQANKGVWVVLFGLLGSMWASQAKAIDFIYNKGEWQQAVSRVFWDVNLDGGKNAFGSGYSKGDEIFLPPNNSDTLTFNKDASVEPMAGFCDYINNTENQGLAMLFKMDSNQGEDLIGTFRGNSVNNFGFEFLPTVVDQTVTITVSGKSKDFVYTSIPEHAQFFGWVSDEPVSFFSISSIWGVQVGNFVVPDAGMTIGFLGCSLLGLSALRRWIS